jgi:hypothetical protein
MRTVFTIIPAPKTPVIVAPPDREEAKDGEILEE